MSDAETIGVLVTALDRIANLQDTAGVQLIAIAALHAYDPSRNKIPNLPLPVIDTTIKPPARHYPERQS